MLASWFLTYGRSADDFVFMRFGVWRQGTLEATLCDPPALWRPTSGTVAGMPEPVFTETMQIGIIVRDLDAAVQRYVEDFGIGPWQFYDVTADKAPNLRHYGNPNIGTTRCATAKVGSVWWELIEPVGDEGIFARFLAEKGQGVHHIAVKTPNYDEAVAKHKPDDLPLSGSFMDIQVAYLPTERDLGVLLEVFKGFPDEEQGTSEG